MPPRTVKSTLKAQQRFSFNQKSSSVIPSYERNQSELVQELLNFCLKSSNPQKCARDSTSNYLTKNHDSTLISTYRQPNNPQDEHSRLSPEATTLQRRQHVTFNDYFSQKKSISSTPRMKGYSNPVAKDLPSQTVQNVKIQAFANYSPPNKQSVLDEFLKEQKTMIADLISQDNSKNVEGSSHIRTSPHRSIRKTETHDPKRNKSPRSKTPKVTNRSPQRISLLSIEKVPEINIKVTPYGLIKHNNSMEMSSKTPKAIRKQNINSSRSVIMVTESQYVPPSQLRHVTPDVSNVLESIKVAEQPHNIDKIETKPAKWSSKIANSKKNDKIEHLKIQIDLPELMEIQSSKTDHYNYDDSEHIFDKNPPVINVEDIQSYFHIQDKQKFKKEVASSSQSFKEKIKIIPRREKQKTKLFDSCQQLAYKKKQQEAAVIKVAPQEEIKDNENQKQQQDAEQSFHFFNFLKDKLTFLNKKQDAKKQAQSAIELNQNKQEILSLQNKAASEEEQPDQAMQLHQPSNHSSSSSFYKQKMLIEEKGVRNIDLTDLIGETVKRVSVNLEKASENMKKNKQQSQSQKPDLRQKQSVSARQVKSERPSFQKTYSKKTDSKIELGLKNNKSINNPLLKKTQSQVVEEPVEEPKKQEMLKLSTEKYSKIFGQEKKQQNEKPAEVQEQKRSSQINQSSQFFDKANQRQQRDISHPSTVEKADSHSADKSLLNQLNFDQGKDDSMIANLFQKPEPEQKAIDRSNKLVQQSKQIITVKKEQQQQNTKKEQVVMKPEESKNVSMNFSNSYQQSQQPKPKEININLADFPSIVLSQDAISLSKFDSVVEQQVCAQPTMNSFKLNPPSQIKQQEKSQSKESSASESKQVVAPTMVPEKDQTTSKQKEIQESKAVKRGKVRKIDINLSDSSDDDSYDSIVGDPDEKEADISSLKDYDSDEEEPSNPARISTHQKIRQRLSSLFPVVEEDLQESQMLKNKMSSINQYPKISLQKQSSNPNKEKDSIKQLEEEFLKDFNMEKKESEVEKYQVPSKFHKKSSEDNKQRKQPIKKIKLKQTDSNIMSSKNQESVYSAPVLEQDKEESSRQQKQFIEDIKGDIQNLKNKISSSFNLDMSKQSIKSQPKVATKKNSGKNINIDISDSFSVFDKYREDSTIKRLRQGSNFTKPYIPGRNSIESPDKLPKTKTINFEQINTQSQAHLYSEFKDDLNSLKQKMEQDILK